jgi:hypothetical protein
VDVTVCASLDELEAGIKHYPQAVVVSDLHVPVMLSVKTLLLLPRRR